MGNAGWLLVVFHVTSRTELLLGFPLGEIPVLSTTIGCPQKLDLKHWVG
jgi:hypothetical protein